MGYLIAVLFPGLLLAAALGAVAGWELHRARSRSRIEALSLERERELKRLLLAGDPDAVDRAIAEERALAQAVADQLSHTQARLAGSEAERARLTEETRQLKDGVSAANQLVAELRANSTTREQALIVELRKLQGAGRQSLSAEGAASISEGSEVVGLRNRYREVRLAWLERLSRRKTPTPAPRPEPPQTAQFGEAQEAGIAFQALEEEATRLRWQNRYLTGRNKRLETLLIEGMPKDEVRVAPESAAQAMSSADETSRRAYWRAQYLEARARHLEGALGRARALAAAVGDLQARLPQLIAERDALRAEASRLARALAASRNEPVLLAPRDFADGPLAWTSQASGAAEDAPEPAGWSIVDADGARVAEAAGGFRELRPKSLVRLEPGRIVRITARVRQSRDAANGGGQWAGVDAFPALDAAFAVLPQDAAPKLQDAPGAQRVVALTAEKGWVTLTAILASTDPRAVWVRPRVYVNWRGERPLIGDGAAQIVDFAIEDITDLSAEAQSQPPSQPQPQPQAAPPEEDRRKVWRARYLEARVRRLEALLAATAPRATPPVETAPAPPAQTMPPTLVLVTPPAQEEPAEIAARQPEPPPPVVSLPEPAVPSLVAPIPLRPRTRPERLPAPRDGLADDLRRLAGIDARLERALNDVGIFHYDQIAGWSDANIAWVDRHLSLKGRVDDEKWVGQARRLAGLDAANS